MRPFVLVPLLAATVTLMLGGVSSAAVNCSNFSSQLAAQNYYNAQVGDPDGLDTDHDGWACESLPGTEGISTQGFVTDGHDTDGHDTYRHDAGLVQCPIAEKLTRSKAIAALKTANCAAGKITKPKKKKKHKTLKVKTQSVAAGTVLPMGTTVNFKLGY